MNKKRFFLLVLTALFLVAGFSLFPVTAAAESGWVKDEAADADALALTYNSDDELTGAFPGFGVWHYDGSWSRIVGNDAVALAYDNDNNLVGAFPGFGIYVRDGNNWENIAPNDATSLAYKADGELTANFPGWGVYHYDGSEWTIVTGSEANSLVYNADGNLVASFPGFGVYERVNNTWVQLADVAAFALTSVTELAGTFPGFGVWVYDGGQPWEQLTNIDATALAYNSNDDLAGAFGPFGVWYYQELGYTTPLVIGDPTVNPALIPKGITADVRITIEISYDEDKLAPPTEDKPSPLEVFINTGNNEWQSLGHLFDDGDLANHGDEIKGDQVFSNIFQFKEEVIGIALFRIVITDDSQQQHIYEHQDFRLEVIETTGGQAVVEVIDTHNTAESILDQALEDDPQASVQYLLDKLGETLEEDDKIHDATRTNNVLKIAYESGLESFIAIQEEEEGMQTRNIGATREIEKNIPLSKQTRGVQVQTNSSFPAIGIATNDQDYELITSRNVLIWAPFAAEFTPYDETASVTATFEQSDFGFEVDSLANHAATVDSLRTFPNYGFIVIATHGAGGRWVGTGEEVTETNANKYEIEQTAGQIAVWQNMLIQDGSVLKRAPVYAVNDNWIRANMIAQFPNTVIVNNSCESTMTDQLWEAFRSKGVGAYYGHSKVVSSAFCVEQVVALVEMMAVDELSTGEAYTTRKDPYYSSAVWQLRGKDNLKFAPGLINGSFEEGLTAWSTDGDGRAIYSLGSQFPTHGQRMGIISTGLGYTVRHGSISQTFQVPENASTLCFDWNYLSEEFLEFIGSVYDDPFEVSLTTADQSIHQIMRVSVNSLAAEFGAVQAWHDSDHYLESGGDLVYVSPTIVFDRGHVWMTGWQYNQSYDISPFQGEVVTLRFYATDAVDTIYHTAVLLDNIRLE